MPAGRWTRRDGLWSDSTKPQRSPLRWVLTGAAVANVVFLLWLLFGAVEADGTWPVAWRLTLACVLGMAALLQAIGAVLGLADRRRSIS